MTMMSSTSTSLLEQSTQTKSLKNACRVSRQSGQVAGTGTFGKSARFSYKVQGPGSQSPSDDLYYSRNRLFKTKDEVGREATLGIGDRPAYISGHRNVGPGSYDVVLSRAKANSPLDGPEFCGRTLKGRLKGALDQHPVISPGPRYNIGYKPGQDLPKYSLGPRTPLVEDHSGPGPGHNFADHLSIGASVGSLSMPDLKGSGNISLEATGGTKRCIRSTFGCAPRFGAKADGVSQSPSKDLYYAHSKIWDAETYLSTSRTCSMGGGQRTDFGAMAQTSASPVSYDYARYTSSAKKTSPIDGFADRGISPVRYYSKKPQPR